jgi:putative FmdB family regulatory protein
MPTYEYRCPRCGTTFERVQKITSRPLAKCPKCGGRAERLLSPPGLVFKGSGFYITDYKRSGQKPEQGEGAAEKAEKPATVPKPHAAKPAKTKDH